MSLPSVFAWCRVRFLATINDRSPTTPTSSLIAGRQPYPLPFGYEETGERKERLCLLTDFDFRDASATIYLATTRHQVLHRFAPLAPTQSREGQLQPALQTVPADVFPAGVYLNLSHPIRATVFFVNDRQRIEDPPPVELFAVRAKLTDDDQRRFEVAVQSYRRRVLGRRGRALEQRRQPPTTPSGSAGGGSGPGSTAGASDASSAVQLPGTSTATRTWRDVVASNQQRYWAPTPDMWEELSQRAPVTPLHWEGTELVGGLIPPDDRTDAELEMDISHFKPCISARLCPGSALSVKIPDEEDVVDAFIREAYPPQSCTSDTFPTNPFPILSTP